MAGLIPAKLLWCSEKHWMCRHWDIASPVLGQGGVHRSLCKGTAVAGPAELQVLEDFRDICGCLLSHCDLASGCGETSWRESRIKVN